ncbi:DUF2637 domain-containing protein (plasmid) [Streptomyces sp. SDT5-1]|uniref:DUF2637 domain-containing protein n=1 Tax=Streptomyces sp. SDT5-1 TaxID=3406418 RepID=UPI003FD43D51
MTAGTGHQRGKIQLTRAHRILIGLVVAGAVVIAGIGFAGSYSAVRELAEEKGFGTFAYVFPIGVDCGIAVCLALDLLLTWIRIPFPLLRQVAWLLTAATIAFNGAAAWGDPLGVGMHAVIPVLFIVAVEAARHAVGRIADITADRHMEGVRITRWLLSPGPTFLLWRRMKLWEIRRYSDVIQLEQQRLVYQAQLRSRFGRNWRRKAPVESLMPLRLARYGVPLARTAPEGLQAAGLEVPNALLPAPASARAELAPSSPQEAADTTTAHEPAEGVRQRNEALAPDDFRDHYEAFWRLHQVEPTALQFAHYLHEQGIHQADQSPLPEEQLRPLLALYSELGEGAARRDDHTRPEQVDAEQLDRDWADFYRHAASAYAAEFGNTPDLNQFTDYLHHHHGLDAPDPRLVPDNVTQAEPEREQNAEATAQPAPVPSQRQRHQVDVPLTDTDDDPDAGGGDQTPEAATVALTVPDHYFLAYERYVTTHGQEPSGAAAFEELSNQLAADGITGHSGRPVTHSTLRRYALEQRIYRRWVTEFEEQGVAPTADAVLARLVHDGVTAGNRTPTLDDIARAEKLANGFARRYEALRNFRSTAQG